MPTYRVEDHTLSIIPEDTFIRAVLEKVEEKTIEWKEKGQNKSAEILEWTWRVRGGQYDGQLVRGSCDPRLSDHEANRFRLWSEAHLGRELDVDEAIDTDDFIGRTVEIAVVHKTKGDRTYVNVDTVVPAEAQFPDDVPFSHG